MKKLVFAFVLLGFLIHLSCGPIKRRVLYPAEVNSEMQIAFDRAEQHYRQKNFSHAYDVYRSYIETFPHNRLTDESYYKIGKIYFLESKWSYAIDTFQELARITPAPNYQSKAHLMAGYAAFLQGDFAQASQFLSRVNPDSLSSKMRIRHFSLKVLAFERMPDSQVDVDYAVLQLADLYEDADKTGLADLRGRHLLSRGEVMQRLDAWMIRPITLSKIPVWFNTYPSGFSRPYVDYKWGKTLFEAGTRDRARRQLSRFVQSYPKHAYTDHARQILKELGEEVPVPQGSDSLKIGLLIPLSGPRAHFGEALMRGIRCAAGVEGQCADNFARRLSASMKVDLITRDSGSETEDIPFLVDDLVREGVSAIIGPMSAPQAVVAAEKAQQVHIPLFPITQKSDIMSEGNYVFQMGYEADQQVADLVRRARGLGIKTFGIFYPDNNYGREMAQLYENELKSQGGDLVTRASYDPSKEDLTSETRKIKLNVSHFSYSGKGDGFEALFIPDSYLMVSRIIPALQYVAIEGVTLLGTNAWNDPQLPHQLLQSYPDSFFMDIFYAGSSRSTTTEFVSWYRTTYGKDPTSLEALGFDTIRFILQGAQLAGGRSPTAIKDGVLSIDTVEGVTGIRSFKTRRSPVVEPYVLTAGGEGGIREVGR